MLAPAGAEKANETPIPITKHTTERMAAQMVTFLKLLKIRIAEREGNTTKLEIIIAPISRIPTTIVSAVKMAMRALYEAT